MTNVWPLILYVIHGISFWMNDFTFIIKPNLSGRTGKDFPRWTSNYVEDHRHQWDGSNNKRNFRTCLLVSFLFYDLLEGRSSITILQFRRLHQTSENASGYYRLPSTWRDATAHERYSKNYSIILISIFFWD